MSSGSFPTLHRLVVAAFLCLASSAALAQDAAQGTGSSAPEGDSAAVARTLLFDMARFLGGTARFGVKLRAGYDVVQVDGRKIEFGERREVSVERPLKFLSVLRESNGRSDVLLLDGKRITISEAGSAVYATAPQPGDLDTGIVYFVRDLNMRLPVAALFMSRFAEELERRVVEIEYVEQTEILGPVAHHLAGRTNVVDFQIWIRDGAEPLPLRVLLSYRNEPGHPQFWVDFSDWNLDPRFPPDHFLFDPQPGAEQIPFAAQFGLPQAAGDLTSGAATESTP